ncbi:MFS transporter [Candidatus Poribacteria bacterium]
MLACIGHGLTHAYMIILPVLLLQIRNQFDLSTTHITFLGTLCYFLYGAMALPGGFLADKTSYKLVLVIFFFGTPAAACVVGSAQSALGLGVGFVLLGLFASFYHPSGLAMISHEVRERGKAMGVHGMGGSLGLALSPFIVAGLAMRFSWRHAFYFLSLPGFAAGVIFVIVSRAVLKEESPSADSSEQKGQSVSRESAQRLSVTALILLYVAMALFGFLYRGTMTVLPLYLGRFSINQSFQGDLEGLVLSEKLQQELEHNKITLSEDASISAEVEDGRWQIKDGKDKYDVRKEGNKLNIYGRRAGKGGLFTTMVLLVGMAGQYMGGHFSDKRRKTRLYLLYNLICLPFMILIGLTSGMLVVVIAAAFSLFHFANQPVENSLVAQYTPSRLRSRSYGLKFFLTFGLGSFGAGFAGYISDHFAFDTVFFALSGVLVLVLTVIALLVIAAKETPVETSQ